MTETDNMVAGKRVAGKRVVGKRVPCEVGTHLSPGTQMCPRTNFFVPAQTYPRRTICVGALG